MPAERPSDILPVVFSKIRRKTPVLALAERPDAPGEWSLICALQLPRLADLVTGNLGLWTDLDHPDRVDGPKLRIVCQPEPGSRLEKRWMESDHPRGYGHESWPYAVPIDLSDPDRRAAVASMISDEAIHVVWVDLDDAEVVCRHEIALTERNVETLGRVLDAAEDRWPELL